MKMGETADLGVTLSLAKNVYDDDSIARAAHEFTARCTVSVADAASGENWQVSFSRPIKLETLESIASDFSRSVLDFTLRSRLRKQTDALRNVIIAQAFSRTNLVSPDLDDVQPGEDPSGFSVPDPETGRIHND